MHHRSFSNNESVDLIRLRFTYIGFTHERRLDQVKYTCFKGAGNKVSCKFVTIVRCRFKTDDVVVRFEKIESEERYMEAISVIREFKQFHEYFVIRRNGRDKKISFGNVHTDIKLEKVSSFLKSDTVISTNDYHCRLA